MNNITFCAVIDGDHMHTYSEDRTAINHTIIATVASENQKSYFNNIHCHHHHVIIMDIIIGTMSNSGKDLSSDFLCVI